MEVTALLATTAPKASDFFVSASTWIQTLASLFAVILAFWGIKIAAATARDQRDNRNFAAYTRDVKDLTLGGYFTDRGVEILHAVRDCLRVARPAQLRRRCCDEEPPPSHRPLDAHFIPVTEPSQADGAGLLALAARGLLRHPRWAARRPHQNVAY